jgi:hypothetical protein
MRIDADADGWRFVETFYKGWKFTPQFLADGCFKFFGKSGHASKVNLSFPCCDELKKLGLLSNEDNIENE